MIIKKLLEVSKLLKGMEQTLIGEGKYAYKAVESGAIIGPVKEAFDKIGVIAVPSIVDFREETIIKVESGEDLEDNQGVKTDNKFREESILGFKVSGIMKVTLYDAADESSFTEMQWAFTGIDKTRLDGKSGFFGAGDPGKAFGKAMTYCHKYLYRVLFNLSAEDDLDSIDAKESANAGARQRGRS